MVRKDRVSKVDMADEGGSLMGYDKIKGMAKIMCRKMNMLGEVERGEEGKKRSGEEV